MKNKVLSLYAAKYMSGTALSRIFGMIRDVLTAAIYGTSPAIATFFIAYRFANLFRRIFAEGGLLNGFVPHYEEIAQSDPKRANQFFKDLTATLSVILIALITLCASLNLFLNHEILSLTTKMLPSLFFISLYGLFSAYLQCQSHFFRAGFAPVCFNLVWIIGILFHPSMQTLSYIVVLAFASQWLFVAIPTFRSITFTKPKLFSKEIRAIMAPFLIATIGVCATQVNSAIDVLFARFASEEGPAYLSYAIRIQQLPLSLFAISMAAALLPTLSKSEPKASHSHLMHAITRALFFLIPATFGILGVGGVIVNLIFGHGTFDTHSVYHTSLAFWSYGLGLVPSGLVILLAPAFYARKDFKTPTIIALIAIGINLSLNTFFVFILGYGAYSVALSTAFAAVANGALLKKKLNLQFDPATRQTLAKITTASVASLLITLSLSYLLDLPALLPFNLSFGPPMPHNLSSQLTVFALPFSTFLASFAAFNYALGSHKVFFLRD